MLGQISTDCHFNGWDDQERVGRFVIALSGPAANLLIAVTDAHLDSDPSWSNS